MVRQQLTRQLITARVQVLASKLLPHTSTAHFKEMCIYRYNLQPWHEANMYTASCNTIAQPPGRPHCRRQRRRHLKGCSRLRARIRSAEMDVTIRSKRVPKRSKQLSRSQVQRNRPSTTLSIWECRARYAPLRRPICHGNQCLVTFQ